MLRQSRFFFQMFVIVIAVIFSSFTSMLSERSRIKPVNSFLHPEDPSVDYLSSVHVGRVAEGHHFIGGS